MHKEDIALFSAMQTIRLREFLVHHKTRFRHESEFAAHIRSEMKWLNKRQSVSKRTFKYFNDVLAPQKAGFAERWSKRLQRYLEIIHIISTCKDKSQKERLDLFFNAMTKLGYAVQIGHGDQLEFNTDDSDKVLGKGFVGLAQTELRKIETGSFEGDVYMTYYLGGDADASEFTIIRSLQSLGFNFYFDASATDGRMERRGFAFVLLVSFAEELVGSAEKQQQH